MDMAVFEMMFAWDVSEENLAAQSGVNFGADMMKQPKLSDVKIDVSGTKRMRNRMAKVKKIKITVNIDADLIEALKRRSDLSGVPYQSLMNKLLRLAIHDSKSDESARIDRLEREIAAIRKKISA